jgi:hypothetical protein
MTSPATTIKDEVHVLIGVQKSVSIRHSGSISTGCLTRGLLPRKRSVSFRVPSGRITGLCSSSLIPTMPSSPGNIRHHPCIGQAQFERDGGT